MTDTAEHSGSGSHGGSGSGSHGGGAFRRRTDYSPTDLVQVRITAAERDRFDAWFETQYPGVQQRPSKDPWVCKVFALGLDRIEKLMPPVLSPEDRLAAAIEGGDL